MILINQDKAYNSEISFAAESRLVKISSDNQNRAVFMSHEEHLKYTDVTPSLTKVMINMITNRLVLGLGLWSLTPLSTIFQLYRGSQSY